MVVNTGWKMKQLSYTCLLSASTDVQTQHKRKELQFQGVKLCHLLVEKDESWIRGKTGVVDCLKKIWLAEDYASRMSKVCLFVCLFVSYSVFDCSFHLHTFT